MDSKTILADASARMQKAVDFLEETLLNIRAGKASILRITYCHTPTSLYAARKPSTK